MSTHFYNLLSYLCSLVVVVLVGIGFGWEHGICVALGVIMPITYRILLSIADMFMDKYWKEQ